MDIGSTTKLRSGNTMPILGLGTWELTQDTSGVVGHALELGYRMIDTASDYGSQPGIGEAVRKTNIKRESLFIVIKVEEQDDAYVATEQYLGEMGLEYADLTLIHRPPVDGAGEELWNGLIKARQEGLAKDIGVSNYTEGLIQELIDATGEVPTVNQIEWSPFGNSIDMIKFCDGKNIVIQAYSPLTRGRRLNDETVLQIAAKYSKTPAQILIRWNLQLGTVPLPKANRRDHLEENIAVFDFELSDDDISRLSDLNENYSALMGSLPYV